MGGGCAEDLRAGEGASGFWRCLEGLEGWEKGGGRGGGVFSGGEMDARRGRTYCSRMAARESSLGGDWSRS